MNEPKIISLSKSATHTFNKYTCDKINLLTGLGVEGDTHMGKGMKHRSRNPKLPNLRQVHLMHSELFDELKAKGFIVEAARMGENITTRNIALLDLPRNTILSIGEHVRLKVTGLRNPCNQINSIQPGLMEAVLDKDDNGNLIRKAGIMSIVISGGEIVVGDEIKIELPEKPYEKLEPV